MYETGKTSILPNIIFTRNLILRLFCGIYLCAFLSFYIQAQGLFSHVDGIVPAELTPIRGKFLHDQLLSFIERPNWIRVFKLFHLATFPSIEIISLLGATISFLGFVSTRFCTLTVFSTLWTFYFSLVDISSTFHQQADDLLLEAGLVCILLAPGFNSSKYGVSDNVMLHLMRWVLFRFIFASGAVKLASGCPHWWNLTALKHHLLTLPLPTHLAFCSYYIPDEYLKLTTAFVQLSELICPWLFFAPIRSLRIFAFYWQLFLQICVIATGNYGFLPFMIIAMLLSLLDDSHFTSRGSRNGFNFRKVFSLILMFAVLFFIVILASTLYKITFVNDTFDVIILFTKTEYMNMLRQMIKLSPFIATITVINVFLQSCVYHPTVLSSKGFFAKITKIIHLLALTMLAISLIGCSTVPHGKLHPETNISSTSIGKAYDEVFHKYHVVHEYGLHLGKMRSERMELGFQYTDSDLLEQSKPKQWKDYYVTYRPVNKNHSLPYAGLFFSRIDFKFHEAVGRGAKLENNLWLAGFMKQLLRNNRAALLLLSHQNLAKVRMPPNFVRLGFLRVSYDPKKNAANNGLWQRQILNADYLPPMNLSSEKLKALLKSLNIMDKKEKEAYPKLLETLKQIRFYFEATDPHIVINGIIVASLLIMMRLRKY